MPCPASQCGRNGETRVKDLLERILKQLPGYLPDLASLVARPKTAMLQWVGEAAGDLTRPLTFVGVSVAIGFLLQLPQLGKEDTFTTLVASMAVFKVLALVMFAAIIQLVFRMAGGHASFSATFSAYLYIVSPLYIALVILEIARLGTLRAYDPAIAIAERLDPGYVVANTERWRTFATSSPSLVIAYSLLGLANVIAVFGWFVVCWGVFRDLHRIGRWRSTLAGVVTLVVGVIFFSGLQYIMLGMFGARVPPLR
jgi:Yip1 domain